MINEQCIESWKEELARASNKADEDAKTIAELKNRLSQYEQPVSKIDIPTSLQDHAG